MALLFGLVWVLGVSIVIDAIPSREGHAVVYDTDGEELVLFGGRGPSGELSSETWVRSQNGPWTRVETKGPSARHGHAMLYDSKRGRVLLFGGEIEGGRLSAETWEWQKRRWKRLETDVHASPRARRAHSMAFDAGRGIGVLVGGHDGRDPLDDVWEWTGSHWRPSGEGGYAYVAPTRDGIGKLYYGREISKVMGHLGAGWLERSSRVAEEKPEEVVRELDLRETDVVADIGAGTGYFTFRMCRRVPKGRVMAVDIQEEMLVLMRERSEREGVHNVVPLLGTIDDPRLPEASVDVALMVDAYHEFSHPREMIQNLLTALKPGGRAVLIEYRGEDPTVPIKPLHKMTQAQVRKELEPFGLEWVETKDFLPNQHFLVFRKSLKAGEDSPEGGR